MNIELGLFCQLMTYLWHRHDIWERGRNVPGKASLIYNRIEQGFRKIENERVLEKLLPADDRPIANFGKQFLYLEPIERGDYMVPVLSLQYDLNRSPAPKFCFQLLLFLLDSKENLQAIGYRFETPEGEDEGRHHYYHAQLIRTFQNDSPGWCANCRAWLPETQPAFALDARSPVTLLLCLLVSLYDLQGVNKILNGVNFRDHLMAYVRQMTCYNLRTELKKKSRSRRTN